MENLVNMIEGILEKSNRIQQNFLDRIEANDLRLSRLEGRIESIENGIKDLYANQSNVLAQLDGIADRQKLMSGLVENIEDKLIDLS
tara:strand:- start:1099 stop:1359 length:261 start_codon:yes stop_codon:yes gene_type:complete